ncbi:hypothetical protein [Aeromicrobium fastidiosum]|uniref:Uncharacterized protein n=1 Tax=Aeromicrobium fastidiosum TaxID=52699 RepID=A0A641AKR4_9ACTN|nr:hypothetical protein [Aeromicrobium fastidiosum]KAA1376417.1 hypothetical protein ESP62_013395 [Aeromicrobium fastidiosum]MBP2391671.1 hypothetical protein [Aeromicrobium fastidiosum]
MTTPPPDLRHAISSLTHAVSSQDPTDRTYLKVVRPGDEFAYGTVAPAINDGWALDTCGMWLPRGTAKPRGPIERAYVFITPEELFGFTLSFAQVLTILKQVSRLNAVTFAAAMLAKRATPGLRLRGGDVEFIEAFLADPWKTKALNLMRERDRALVVPQAIHLLAKLAFIVCPEEAPVEVDQGEALLTVLLHLPAHLDSGVEALAEDEDHTVTADAGPLACYFIANHLFNSHLDVMTATAVFQRCWIEIPAEDVEDPRMLDLPAEFEDATGVPLGDLTALCVMLWASAVNGNTVLEISRVNAFGWSTERLERALDLISCDPDQMRTNIVTAEHRYGLLWTTRNFAYHPVIRWGSHVTVLDPELLLRRATGLWPLMDIQRALEDGPQRDRDRASQVSAAAHRAHEKFALETLRDVAGKSRLYDEDALVAAYGRKSKVADMAVDYGHSWVAIEVTTTGFQDLTAAGTSPEAVTQDLNKAVRKAKQLHATIDNLRRDTNRLTKDGRSNTVRTFYPVLVVTTRFPASPITMTMLWERLREEDLLQGDDVAPLEVMELEDLCATEGAVEVGHSLMALLDEKRTSPMQRMSMRDFLQDKLRGIVRQPKRVQDRWQKVFDPVIDAVRDAA